MKLSREMGAGELEALLVELGRRIVEHGPESVFPHGSGGVEVEFCPDRAREVLAAGACRLGYCGCKAPELNTLAAYIDHTLLKPEATLAELDKLCDEALKNKFASVCVNGAHVRRCAEILAGSGVLVCSVIGFPLGSSATEVKCYEARRAIEDGACEIDMVMNVGLLKSGADAAVERDIAAVAETCHKLGARLKVILETCLLTDVEKVRACEASKRAGADFVKTSTGFNKGGATAADIALMRRTVGDRMGVKASGGVRDQKTAQEMIAAGATRIGASASVAIVKGGESKSSY